MALPATETFTASNGTTVDSLANWSKVSATGFSINTNAAHPNYDTTDCIDRWDADSFDNDQYAECEVVAVTSGYYAGPGVRCASGALTAYEYYVSSARRYLNKVVAGVWEPLTPYEPTGASVNDILRLEADGTTITPLLNGSEDEDLGAQTDGSIESGYAGITGYGLAATSMRIDNWEGGNLAAGLSIPIAMDFYRRLRV